MITHPSDYLNINKSYQKKNTPLLRCRFIKTPGFDPGVTFFRYPNF